MAGLIRGKQLKAARALASITQEELAEASGLHVNSVRYLERQDRITCAFSTERVETALNALGVMFFTTPTPGVRVMPGKPEFE
jgi:transcriptional regulator with XRE-family HTH domain